MFGGITAADLKVFNEERESVARHRYAVIVQDLAPQWMQAYLCKRNLHKRR